MSSVKQSELDELLEKVFLMDEVNNFDKKNILRNIRFHLIEAGEKVYQSNNSLTDQLRKFLDEQIHLENKRIIDIIKNIEKNAVDLKNDLVSDKKFINIDFSKVDISISMARTLFTPPVKPEISSEPVKQGLDDFDISSLYNQVYVDEEKIKSNIERALQKQQQLTLKKILEIYPLEKGLAELVGYISVSNGYRVNITDEKEIIEYEVEESIYKRIEIPKIIFVR